MVVRVCVVSACGDDAVPAGFALKLGIVDAGDGKGSFPVCHGVKDEEVNIAAVIRMTSIDKTMIARHI